MGRPSGRAGSSQSPRNAVKGNKTGSRTHTEGPRVDNTPRIARHRAKDAVGPITAALVPAPSFALGTNVLILLIHCSQCKLARPHSHSRHLGQPFRNEGKKKKKTVEPEPRQTNELTGAAAAYDNAYLCAADLMPTNP